MTRILVVEDDPLNRKLFQAILTKRGNFTVHCTEDPEEILRVVRGKEVRLVVLDIALTNSAYQGKPVDGLRIARMLKDDPETAWVPVILASAHAMKGDNERFCSLSGAEDYVTKPIVDPNDLIRRINTLLEATA